MKTNTKPDAQAEYRKQLQKVQDQLLALSNHLDTREDERQKAGIPANWGQVGSIIHVRELLSEICSFLDIPTTS